MWGSDKREVNKTLITWYVGCTGSGKTTLALQDLQEDIKKNKHPALVIDSQGVKLLSGIRHARSWQETARIVWKKKKNCAFIPTDKEQVSNLFAVAREIGFTNCLLDEGGFWMSSRSIERSVELALRTHLHTDLNLRITTQNIADLAPIALQCTSRIKTFRCTSPRTLKRLSEEFGYKPEEIEKLERGQFIEKGMGF